MCIIAMAILLTAPTRGMMSLYPGTVYPQEVDAYESNRHHQSQQQQQQQQAQEEDQEPPDAHTWKRKLEQKEEYVEELMGEIDELKDWL